MIELSDRTLSRTDLAPLAGGDAVTLTNCTLDEANLRDLDLTGWRFERCSLGRTDFGGASLELATFAHCRGAAATFRGAHLDDARFEACDFVVGLVERGEQNDWGLVARCAQVL